MTTASNVIKSSGLLLITKFIQRGIGVFSTILLARLLVPSDFGIVAISVTIIYFIEAISSLGSEQYIIQKSHVDDSTLNTAWTIDIILKAVILMVFLNAIPFIAEFYDNPKLEPVLFVGSTIILINAFKNPAFFLLKRNLQYLRIFWLSVVQKIVSFLVVITIALVEPSYWAMVVGDVVAATILTFGSYKIHEFRPKLSLQGFYEQWLFSKWAILRGMVGYSKSQIDTFIVSTVFNTQQLGGFHLVRQLSIMPSTDIIAPATEPLLAAYATTKHDKNKLAYHFRISFLIIFMIAAPIAGYIYLKPEPIVDTLLGGQWSFTYEYLSAFSVFFLSIALTQVLVQLCTSIGQIKILFIYEVFSFVLVLTVLWAIKGFDLEKFILIRGFLGLLSFGGLFVYLNTQIPIGFFSLLKMVAPVGLSLGLTILIVQVMDFSSWAPFLRLSISGTLYLLIYTAILAGTYVIYSQRIKEWRHIKDLFSDRLNQLVFRVC